MKWGGCKKRSRLGIYRFDVHKTFFKGTHLGKTGAEWATDDCQHILQ